MVQVGVAKEIFHFQARLRGCAMISMWIEKDVSFQLILFHVFKKLIISLN